MPTTSYSAYKNNTKWKWIVLAVYIATSNCNGTMTKNICKYKFQNLSENCYKKYTSPFLTSPACTVPRTYSKLCQKCTKTKKHQINHPTLRLK